MRRLSPRPGSRLHLLDAKRRPNAGQGSLRRAHIEIPKGENAAHRSDIEVLYSGLPEPIDLAIDLTHRMIYWADRGDPPAGNTVTARRWMPQRAEFVRRRA